MILQRLEAKFRRYQTLILTGTCWGDEGKGAVSDFLLYCYDIVARYSGGGNAGHTVYTPDGRKVVTHLIPSGIAQGKTCVIAPGVLFDLARFIEEYREAEKTLGQLPKIYVDFRCPIWTPYHALLETALERARGKEAIGTTGKAIGPMVGLNALRFGLRLGDLRRKNGSIKQALEFLRDSVAPLLREHDLEVPEPDNVLRDLVEQYDIVREMTIITDTSLYLWKQIQNGRSVLFEGAQGPGLDLFFGTYPFVSSGMSNVAGAPYCTGLPIQVFKASIMVAKVFPTRVGAGPFPSEMWDRKAAEQFPLDHPQLFDKNNPARQQFLDETLSEVNKSFDRMLLSQYLQVLGMELGATTGRGRSLGYPDIPWLRYATRINGPNWLVLTRLDMLSGMREIPVASEWKLGETRVTDASQVHGALDSVSGVHVDYWRGWKEDIQGAQSEHQLPLTAREFLNRMGSCVGVPVLLAKTGPERDAIVMRDVA